MGVQNNKPAERKEKIYPESSKARHMGKRNVRRKFRVTEGDGQMETTNRKRCQPPAHLQCKKHPTLPAFIKNSIFEQTIVIVFNRCCQAKIASGSVQIPQSACHRTLGRGLRESDRPAVPTALHASQNSYRLYPPLRSCNRPFVAGMEHAILIPQLTFLVTC